MENPWYREVMKVHNLTIACRIELQVVVADKASPEHIEDVARRQLDELLADQVQWIVQAGPASKVEPPDPESFLAKPYVLMLDDGRLKKSK